MNIIGISGLARSGKDTFANLLLESTRGIKIALADPIKRFIAELWGFSDDALWGPSENRSKEDPRYPGLTPRKALQTIGTDICRLLDKDVYSRYGITVAKTLLTETCTTYTPQLGLIYDEYSYPSKVYDLVIISDARFLNELSFIKNNGGKLIKIKRDLAGLSGKEAVHQSESEMLDMSDDMFDFIIENNGTLKQLKREAKRVVKLLSMPNDV
jgi:hypothetical protein